MILGFKKGEKEMVCKYKKYPDCITTNCKWYVKDRCLLDVVEEKLESPQALEDFHNIIDVDNKPIINNCPYCNTALSGHTNIFKRFMDQDSDIYQVFCHECHLRGPKGTTALDAITNFNNLSSGS